MKSHSGRLLLLAMLAFQFLLSACGGSSSSSSGGSNNSGSNNGGGQISGGGSIEQKTFYDQVITADDGEDIAFTVFVPDNPTGRAAPLIVHGHGFGLSRITDLENPDPISAFVSGDVSGDVAKRAWLEEGFYVISFDQRGFGDSTGSITVMDPAIDCRNVSAILDWAESNLVNLSHRNGDPQVGAIGLSYGGGFQTVCASVDDRFDALVPLATWNHLPYSLYANSVPNSLWLDFLAVASQGNLEPYLIEALFAATTTGDIDPDTVARLAGNSPRSFCNREQGRSPSGADALFIQGSNDALFNMNEAVANYECWREAGNEAHLFIQRDGHILPALQTAGELILFGTEPVLNCGGTQFNTRDMAMAFLRSKLLGQQPPALPDICFSIPGTDSGRTLSEVPRGGQVANVPLTAVTPGAPSTLVDLLTGLPLQTLLAVLQGLPAEGQSVLEGVLSGLSDPATLADYADDIINLLPSELVQKLVAPGQFIPVFTADAPGALAGIPLANLAIGGGNGDDNTLYLGIGRIPASGGDPELLNEQVLPVKGTGVQLLELVGLAAEVSEGDVVGLMVYGFHPYNTYLGSLLQPPIPAELVGTVDLPLVD